ncbi:MAG: hypothetical protein EOO17_05505 [Chloroflexi bacterium]|nr:MAG: hypothetical protein EOO17_05505 [Chloroflexota bacterium]
MSKNIFSLSSRLTGRQKKTMIALLVVVILAITAGAYYFLNRETIPESERSNEPTAEDIAKAKADVDQSIADGNLRQEAFDNVNKNNTDAAGKVYEKAVASEASQERKSELAIDLSGVYYAAGEYDKAFAVMKDVEASNPDKFLVADWLSRLYEDQKRYQDAARYYKLAGEWAESPQNKTGIGKSFYDAEADRVSKMIGKN